MKDFKERAGIEIKFEDIGLVYNQNEFPVEQKTRTFAEAKEVYQVKNAEDRDLYYMYRYFEGITEAQKFVDNDVEYDITVLAPGKVGEEFIKTAGHYHGYVPNTNLSYPEVYEVIDGEIEYLLQTKPDAEDNVDVVIVLAKAGEKVVVPPNYGHVSINVCNDFSVSSNLQKRDLPATADYETFKVYEGGAVYRTEQGWQNNPQYNIRSIKKVTPKEKPEWGLTKETPLYVSFTNSPEKFKFLTEPQNFNFSDVWLEG